MTQTTSSYTSAFPMAEILGWKIFRDAREVFGSIDAEAAKAYGIKLARELGVRCFFEDADGYHRIDH